MFSIIARSGVVVALFGAQLQGQAFLWELEGDPTTNVRFGYTVTCVGDVDDDGCDDFVVADPYHGTGVEGAFYVYSGRTRALLWSVIGTESSAYMGRWIAKLGDIDGDGYEEFATTSETNHVDVYSARSGTILYSIPRAWWSHGPIAKMGDADLDGVADLLIGGDSFSAFDDAHLYSGKTGNNLYDWPDVGGQSVSTAGDVDGDGFPDALIGSPHDSRTGFENGCVYVYSGKDGSFIREIHGKIDGTNFGFSVRGGHDLDGDGVPDFLATMAGFLVACSGATGGEITSWSVSGGSSFDREAEFAGDVDQDGVTDILLSDAAGVRLISGRTWLDLYLLPGLQGSLTTGDFNGDGVPDILVGDDLTSPTGAVHAYSAGTVFIDGDGSIGSHVNVRFLMHPNDGLLGILGVPPPVSIPTPPFIGNLQISPFTMFALLPPNSWPYFEFDLSGDIPRHRNLIGLQILFQALTGPDFSSGHQNATWTNTATLTIK